MQPSRGDVTINTSLGFFLPVEALADAKPEEGNLTELGSVTQTFEDLSQNNMTFNNPRL